MLAKGDEIMALRRWDPWRDMLSLRNAMDRMFESFSREYGGETEGREFALTVPVDMYETGDNLVVKTDLPGLKPEDVDISIAGSTLSIKGEFRAEEEGERKNVHFRERRYGRFQRSVRLPSNVDTDATEASFVEGVLTVTVPKKEEAKPKQISVRTG